MLNDCNTPWVGCLSGSIAQSEQASKGSVFVILGWIQVNDEGSLIECLLLRGANIGSSGEKIKRMLLKT